MTPMTSIVLTRPHTHAGKSFKAGERLDVDGGTADWLVANGIARHVTEPPADAARIDSDPKPVQRKESKS